MATELSEYIECKDCGKRIRYCTSPRGDKIVLEFSSKGKESIHECQPVLKGIPRNDPEYDYMVERALEDAKK